MTALRAVAGAALVVLVGTASPARADRETAEFHGKRGERMLKQGDAIGAVAEFEKAVAEDADYLPARAGLGEAYAVLGRASEAAEQLRAAVALGEKAGGSIPLGWSEALARARKRLAEVDASGGMIEKIQRKYADELVALSDRWKSKDAAVSDRALRLALRAVPEHAGASKRLEGLGNAVAAPIVVFDGKAFDNHVPTDDPVWSISNGILRGGVTGASKGILSERIFEADVVVRMEARLVSETGDSPKFGMLATGAEDKSALFFGVFEDTLILDVQAGPGTRQRLWTVLWKRVKPPFDPKGWNKYEMRLRGEEVALSINGTPVRKEKRPKERRRGVVGVLVQDVSAEVRRFEVLPL